MPIDIIKLGDEIPNTTFMIKQGAEMLIKETRVVFKDKKILLLGIPGAFVSDYPSSMLSGYEHHYHTIKNLGIDDTYCTSTNDYYVMSKWFIDESIENVKMFPDGNSDWAKQTGFINNMSQSFMGVRTHRYAMIIDHGIVKKVFYENFTHDPHTCFTETNVEKVITYLDNIQKTWENFSS
jgi:peroxiredoxin